MSILKTIPIALDLKRVGAQAQALPTLVEGDNGNVFVISMTDDGEPLDLSTASRVICVFSKTSDGKTVEQDTTDANVSLDDYGITAVGTPAANDTITITNNGGSLTVNVSGSITGAVVDSEIFLEKFPNDGVYEFVFSGESWMYGQHSVTIGGPNHNIVTIALRNTSYGAGTNNCEIQVYSGDNGEYLVTSANFNFRGKKGIMNDETLLAEDRYPVLVSLIADATNAWNNARPFGQPSATLEMLDPDEDAYVNLVKDAVSVRWDFGIPKAEGAPSFDLPLALGTADAGTSLLYSREDHVHPMPTADYIPTDSVGVSVQDGLDSKATVEKFSATITTSWSGGSAPFTQIVSVPGILATDSPVIDVVPSDTFATAQQQLEAWTCIYRIVASAGQITVYADEQTAIAVPIQIMCVR